MSLQSRLVLRVLVKAHVHIIQVVWWIEILGSQQVLWGLSCCTKLACIITLVRQPLLLFVPGTVQFLADGTRALLI